MPTREQLESALFKADAAGNADDAKFLANAIKQGAFDGSQEITAEGSPIKGMMDYAGSFASGVNELVPAIAGLPMDTATALVNLGIAGYGTAKGALGGTDLPELLPPQPGGAQWMRGKVEQGAQAAGIPSPLGAPETENPLQQNLRMAGGIMGSGMLAPAAGPKQMLSNVMKMETPAMGAIVAKEAFPEEPLAPMAGMLLAPGVAPTLAKAKNIVAPRVDVSKAFMKANKLGYKVPPALAKPTKTQQALEGTAGPVPMKQAASIYNQKITNDLIKTDLGYPKDMPLSAEGLNFIRQQAGKAYENAKTIGAFKADQGYINSLSGIAKQGSAMARDFPAAVRKDISEMVKGYARKQMSAEGTIDAVRQLRAESNAGYNSTDPAISGMARAKGKVAEALESLMERQAAQTHPELVPELQAARQRIAKTYTIQNALKGENIDAVALGRQLVKGKKLSGAIRDVAEFGQNFKGAAQVNVPQQTNFRPMDVMTGVGGAVATQNPLWLIASAARPALRTALLSKPYQAALARQSPAAVQRIMQLPKEAQAAAIASLLEDVNNQAAQGNSQ